MIRVRIRDSGSTTSDERIIGHLSTRRLYLLFVLARGDYVRHYVMQLPN